MSFYASNNRFYITNSAGKVIFDTNKPMPHIVQTLTAQVSVSFPQVDSTYWRSETKIFTGSFFCPTQVYECRYVYGCEWENVCGPKQVCGYKSVCNYNVITGQYECGLQWVCETQNVCEQQNVCAYRWKCQNWDTYGDLYEIRQGFDYAAKDWQATYDLGSITGGIQADFLLVNCQATRTAQGNLSDIGPIPCGLPLGSWFVANNSSIVEVVSDLRDGEPFLTRIMSVFVEGGKVKVQFKHSNRTFRAVRGYWEQACSFNMFPPFVGGIPTTPPTGISSYTFNFTIQVGKFTI